MRPESVKYDRQIPYLYAMNFLAHIYLSGNDEGIIIGNFIADSIKGNKYQSYPAPIQRGILLHRAIDSFTDNHPIVRQSTKRLHQHHSHYSGVIVDMFYDHFLAKNWDDYSAEPLESYIASFYKLIKFNYDLLPSRIQRMMPHMITNNWLLSYRSMDGIAGILWQMNQRAKGKARMDTAIVDLEKHYEVFEKEFTQFFDELIDFTQHKLKEI